MNIEERLSASFKAADTTIPPGRLDYQAAIGRAKTLRRLRFAAVGAVVAAVALGGLALGNDALRNSGSAPIAPVGPNPTEKDATDDPTPPCYEYYMDCEPVEWKDKAGVSKVATFQPSQTSDKCSGGLDAHPGTEQEGLPAVVDEMRREIIVATWTCDYMLLQELADHGRPVDYDDRELSTKNLEHYLRSLERSGEPMGAVTRILARTLETSPTEFMTEDGRVWVWPPAALGAGPPERVWGELESVYERSTVDEMRRTGTFYGYRLEITEQGDWTAFVLENP